MCRIIKFLQAFWRVLFFRNKKKQSEIEASRNNTSPIMPKTLKETKKGATDESVKKSGSNRGRKSGQKQATKIPQVGTDAGVVKKSKKNRKKRPLNACNANAYLTTDPYKKIKQTRTNKKTGNVAHCRCGPLSETNAIVNSFDELKSMTGYDRKSSMNAISRVAVARVHKLIIAYCSNLHDSKSVPLDSGESRDIIMCDIPRLVLEYQNKINKNAEVDSESYQTFMRKFCEKTPNLTGQAREILNVNTAVAGKIFIDKCVESAKHFEGVTLTPQIASSVVSVSCQSGIGPNLAKKFLKISKMPKGDENIDLPEDEEEESNLYTYPDPCRIPTLQHVKDTMTTVLSS